MKMETKTNKIKDRESFGNSLQDFFFFGIFFSIFIFAKLINTLGILHIPYMNISYNLKKNQIP